MDSDVFKEYSYRGPDGIIHMYGRSVKEFM